MDDTAAQAYTDLRYGSVYNLAFDTYCMQHVGKFCRSAKSYAAHLTRMCCGVEHNGDPNVYAAIQRWLSGNASVKKPALLTAFGDMTIADLGSASSPTEYKELIHQWAENVWAAYSSQHTIAHDWIRLAINGSR